jgi:hypothetical protein
MQAEALLPSLPDAVKHGVCNGKVFSLRVVALRHHTPAGGRRAGREERTEAGREREGMRRTWEEEATRMADTQQQPPPAASEVIRTESNRHSHKRSRRSAFAPHARRLGRCQPDAAVLHHHAAPRLHIQLLQAAAKSGKQGSGATVAVLS